MTSRKASRLRTKLKELPPLEEEEVEFFRWLWNSYQYDFIADSNSYGFHIDRALRWLRLKQLCQGFHPAWPEIIVSERYRSYYQFINSAPIKHIVRLRALELAAMFEKEKDVINL